VDPIRARPPVPRKGGGDLRSVVRAVRPVAAAGRATGRVGVAERCARRANGSFGGWGGRSRKRALY